MIHNAVIHINNEQPLLCDLFDMPAAGDVSLVCTNLRTMNGKRPIFADDSSSTFVFPYAILRFIEIPGAREGLPALGDGRDSATGEGIGSDEAAADDDLEIEIDEDFLRRIREA